MEKHIASERTGLKYELVGDYYLVAGDDEPEDCSIGIGGSGISGIFGSTASRSTLLCSSTGS